MIHIVTDDSSEMRPALSLPRLPPGLRKGGAQQIREELFGGRNALEAVREEIDDSLESMSSTAQLHALESALECQNVLVRGIGADPGRRNIMTLSRPTEDGNTATCCAASIG